MAFYNIHKQQLINAPIDKVWEFFSHPRNLSDLTPAYMNFRITSNHIPDHIYAGQIITYTLTPVLSIPVSWMTEITQVRHLHSFIDEQRSGPYAIWHHEHHFQQQDSKVLMTDLVHYKLPLGPLGNFAHALFVKRQLDNIFEHRYQTIEKLFNNAS